MNNQIVLTDRAIVALLLAALILYHRQRLFVAVRGVGSEVIRGGKAA